MGPIPKSELYAEISECEYVVRPSEAVVWRIGGDFSFANYEDILHRLKKLIAQLPQQNEYKVFQEKLLTVTLVTVTQYRASWLQ